eukprot:Sspe_Gene.44603::Locus_21881_Transcript_1_1_Confidence_1.000_Length_2572::g.44603::m.44603
MSIRDTLREYQKELLDKAEKENMIIFAPTGSGKTRISAALAQQVLLRKPREKPQHNRQTEFRPKNLVVFICNRIPLIEQQADSFEEAFRNSNHKVKITRVSSEHSKGRDDWSVIYSLYDIVFVIDQKFFQLLDNREAYLSDVDLLILDECHHTVGNAGFNRIFNGYNDVPQEHRPHVLGLTASPGPDATYQDTNKKITTLMKNMSSGICMVVENKEELARESQPAHDVFLPYKCSTLEKSCIKSFEKIMEFLEAALNDRDKVLHNAVLPKNGLNYTMTFPNANQPGRLRFRGSVEYRLFCQNQKTMAMGQGRVGMAEAFLALDTLSEALAYLNEVGFDEAYSFLATYWFERKEVKEGIQSENVDFAVAEENEYFLPMVKQAAISLKKKLAAYSDKDERGCTKLKELLMCLRRVYAKEELMGRWESERMFLKLGPTSGGGSTVTTFGRRELIKVTDIELTLQNVLEEDSTFKAKLSFGDAEGQAATLSICGDTLKLRWQNFEETLHRDAVDPALCQRGIVLTQTKKGVQRIVDYIESIESLRKRFRVHSFVGHGKSQVLMLDTTTKRLGMSLKQQKDVVEGFRNGRYNLLIATNVAEEGIDIPVCNLVIRYEAQFSVTSLIQSRGRARAKPSYFVVITREDEAERYEAVKEQEELQIKVVQDIMGVEERRDDLDNDVPPTPYGVPDLCKAFAYHKLGKPEFVFERSGSAVTCSIDFDLEGRHFNYSFTEMSEDTARKKVVQAVCEDLGSRGYLDYDRIVNFTQDFITTEHVSKYISITNAPTLPPGAKEVTRFRPEEWNAVKVAEHLPPKKYEHIEMEYTPLLHYLKESGQKLD